MAPSSQFFASQPPRVLAHRGFVRADGAVGAAPENTLRSFENALALGVTHLETDVRATRDGVAVLCHDSNLYRLAGVKRALGDLTYAELLTIELSPGVAVISLVDALRRFPSTFFNLDIKEDAAVAPTVDAILAAAATHRVLVASFSEKRRSAALRRLPGVATSASAQRLLIAVLAAKFGFRPIMRFALKKVDAVQIPEKIAGIVTSTPTMISAFHAAGCEVHFWTINSASDMSRLLKSGADGLITDRSDIAVKVIIDLR